MKSRLEGLKKFQKGFTLIELLIVIAILGILVTIVIVAINPVRLIHDAQDSRMRSDLQQIKASMQVYYNDCKFYPVTLPSGTWGNVTAGNACDDNSTYMKQVPTPTYGGTYVYASQKSGGGACDNSSNLCTDYAAGAVLNTQTADDIKTTTKCTSPVPTGSPNYLVCND
jgi:prepilin-type N-terminal cleavage/methylation domain-containing protein